MRSIAISVSVCLWNFLYMLTVAVARLSSDSNAMYICISGFVDYVVFSYDILYGTWSWHRRRKRRATANGKKIPTYSSGYATLFDFVVYNGRKLLIGVKSVVYDFFVSGFCRCAKFGRNQSSTAASIENASSVSL